MGKKQGEDALAFTAKHPGSSPRHPEETNRSLVKQEAEFCSCSPLHCTCSHCCFGASPGDLQPCCTASVTARVQETLCETQPLQVEGSFTQNQKQVAQLAAGRGEHLKCMWSRNPLSVVQQLVLAGFSQWSPFSLLPKTLLSTKAYFHLMNTLAIARRTAQGWYETGCPNHHLLFKFQCHKSQDEQSTNKGMILLCRMALSGHKKQVTASLRQQHCSI